MDFALTFLELASGSLALLLSAIAFIAASRYSERRFALVGAGTLALGIVGLMAAIDAFFDGRIPGSTLGYPPTLLLLLAEVLLYLSLVVGRRPAVRRADG